MKYLLKRDTILATALVFITIWIFTIIAMHIEIFSPVEMALKDFSFNDLAYSKLKAHNENPIDKDIVIVNIGDADRKGIAEVINKIDQAKPKVIGLDVLFEEAKGTSVDSVLAAAVQKSNNLVLSTRLHFNEDSKDEKEKISGTNYFMKYDNHIGYVNLIGEDIGVVRYFSPFEKGKDSVHKSFAAAVTELANEDKFRKLEQRDHDVELINYKRGQDQYMVVDYKAILDSSKTDLSVFKGKTVLVGYVNDNPDFIEDKHFTPLNENFTGKSIPDMNGVIIQANIISMILGDQQYISKVPFWVNFIIAVLFTWLFMGLVIKFYIDRHIWFHFVAKTVQLVLSIIFIYIGIKCYLYQKIYFDFSLMLGAIVLSIDVLYIYDGIARKSFGPRTIFNKHHP